MEKDLCPDKMIIEEVIKCATIPIIKRIELEFGTFAYRCSVYVGEKEEFVQTIDSDGNSVPPTEKAQLIRMRFRSIFKPNKLTFRIQVMYNKESLHENSEFTGFLMSGKIGTIDLSVYCPTYVVTYIQRRWWKWW